jgi:signal transduction histidine kinase
VWATSLRQPDVARHVRRLPRIRTLLFATYLAVLLLPVAGVGVLRLYESALLRQTEAELLAQAAVLSAAYRSNWLERAPPGALAKMPRATLSWATQPAPSSSERWIVLLPQLDFADAKILPRAPEAMATGRPPEPVAAQVAKSLAPVVGEVRKMTLAAIRVVDAAGVVVASTGTDLDRSLAKQEEVAHALQGAPMAVIRERLPQSADPGWEAISRNTDVRVFVAVPAIEDGHVLGVVLVSRTPRNIVQTLYGKRYALLGLAAILVVSVLALAWFAGYTIVRPTRQLAAMAQRVASGEVRAVEPLSTPMTHEARLLSDSIVTMARTLEARADYVRDLTLDISHEFKTPLTGIRGGAELLRDHLDDMSLDERQKFVANILADTERLERLVQRILELARADALTPRGDERCDAAAVVAEMVPDLRRKGNRISIDGMPSSMLVAIDRLSLDVVLSNLLANAWQHGGPSVSVSISGRMEGDGALIEVSDDGSGISPGNAERIFDRFFTTARDSGGTGLGLAIARRRLMAFGGRIVSLPVERGASFRITLRAAT